MWLWLLVVVSGRKSSHGLISQFRILSIGRITQLTLIFLISGWTQDLGG